MDLTTSVTVHEPDASWIHQYEHAIGLIQQAFSGQLIAYYHVGSTAIAHLAARAFIDILVEVTNIDQLAPLEPIWHKLRLEEVPSPGVNYRHLRRRPPAAPPLQIHVFEHGDPQVERWLAVKEFLKGSPQIVQLYGKLKRKLMIDSKGDLLSYERGKWRFLQQAMVKSAEHLHPYHTPPRGFERMMSLPQVSKRLWDNYCLYWQTLMHYNKQMGQIPFHLASMWLHESRDPTWSTILRFNFASEEDSLLWRKFFTKEVRALVHARSIWLTPFDQCPGMDQFLPSLGFTKDPPTSIWLMDAEVFQTYDDTKTLFRRLYHTRDLFPWTQALQKEYNLSSLHDFFTNLPSKLFAHGQPIEIYTVEKGGQCLGAFALHLYREGLGIVELTYENESVLQAIVNFAVTRARSLHYPYIFARSRSTQELHLRKLGLQIAFYIHHWRLDPWTH